MTAEQLASSKMMADHLAESSRGAAVAALKELHEQAGQLLRRLENGEKVYREAHFATLAGNVVEALARAEAARENAAVFAWLTGKG